MLALRLLFGTCLPSLCSPPFPFHALALISLFLAKVRLLLTLTLSSRTIRCSGQTALFLFPLARAVLAYLPTAFFAALRPLFPMQQAQYAQVFQLKPPPLCTLSAGLGSTNKSDIFFSFYLTLVLSPPPCPLLHLSFYLKLYGRSGRNCFLSPSVLSDYNGSPDIRFSRRTTRLMSWPDGKRYLRSLQSLLVSLLLSLISTLIFIGLEAYCLIEIIRHTGFLDFHRGTFTPLSRLLCSRWSTLQRTEPSVKFVSL